MPWTDKRPMSPHLQIYRMPITAVLSILHRGTGAVLFIGLLLMIWILVAAASSADHWQVVHGFLSSWFGMLVLFGFTFSLYYHFCNGIRHLLWDIGKGLSIGEVHKSAWVVIFSAIILTLMTWTTAYL
ncbi:MAG: succinate dehydrogenase, cytochrome b556 subunit [Cocleimonas sp.]|nr:succinate dehydrogenase, cytochrome b556 subunit [Cocleimonas sp.]